MVRGGPSDAIRPSQLTTDASMLERPLVAIGGGARGVNVHLVPADLIRVLGAGVADVTSAEEPGT